MTLWKDFDESLPLDEEVLSEAREEDHFVRDVRFSGRETGAGRVRIYARYTFPAGEESFPAVVVLFGAGLPFDEAFVMHFVREGYGVLAVDYCGEKEEGLYTVYPKNVDYANFVRAGRRMTHCDDSAKETSWYEWAAVARYAVRYLASRENVTAVGAIGLRAGGEVLFKIAPFSDLSCFISVCAAGWLAYQGIDKFGIAGEKRIFDEERHRFIAGLDSQSYASSVKCPVLLLSAVNDKLYNYDRVFDTFSQLNPNVEKALLFSAHGNGLLGRHTVTDIDLFLDKNLKGHTVFVSKPITVSFEEDKERGLIVKSAFDPEGEIKEFGIFYTENITAFKTRDWTRLLGRQQDLTGNVGTVPLPLCEESKKALVYAFVNYSNGFSVTSKILEIDAGKKVYANSCSRSRIIFSGEDGRNGFSYYRKRARAIADCFIENINEEEQILPGFGGIKGIDVSTGIISYRVGEPRFRPPEGVTFRFDAYSKCDALLKVIFFKDEDEETGYAASVKVAGGGKWKSVLIDPSDLKTEKGNSLDTFGGVVSVVFESADEVLISNILWI